MPMYEIGIAVKQDKVCRFWGLWGECSTFLYVIQVSTHLFIVKQYNIDFSALSATYNLNK